MKKEDKELAHGLLELALKLRAKRHHMFVYYMAHTDNIDVSIHINGWSKDISPDYRENFYLLQGKEGAESNRLKLLRLKKFVKENSLLKGRVLIDGKKVCR